jgi:hypothetical protein
MPTVLLFWKSKIIVNDGGAARFSEKVHSQAK